MNNLNKKIIKINVTENNKKKTYKYILVSEQKQISDAITEGPFYKLVGDSNPENLYMPSLDWLMGKVENPTMFLISK